ncbi:hypothetical protein MHU86_2423 [Fragilaria crotonensis]|nr:hypothetical protein MHU86_2423 [Fragilaria crotonensis]
MERSREFIFYTNKTTGLLKGDGLVTYETNKEKQITTDFLQSVCQQLHGCELPCGSILHVEPAKMVDVSQPSQDGSEKSVLVDEKIRSEESNGVLQENMTAPSQPVGNVVVDGNDGEDDLDDFFASLA